MTWKPIETPDRFFVREIIILDNGVVTDVQVGNPLLSDPAKCWLECVPAHRHDALIREAEARVARIAAGLFPGGYRKNLEAIEAAAIRGDTE